MHVLPYKPSRSVRTIAQLCLLLAALLTPRARAEDKDVMAAASAYTQAQQAELSGNDERAAELYELADRIAPTPEALRSATRMRLSAEQLASAAGNAEELLRRYPDDAASHALAEQVLSRATPELARFTFQCSHPCSVVVDGYATGLAPLPTQIVYVNPGAHELTIGFEGDLKRPLRLQGSAGEQRTIKVARPAPVAPSRVSEANVAGPVRSRGLSSGWFWTGAGATAVAGAVAIWSGIDDIHARNDFKKNPAPTRAEFHDGESKDRRTSALIGTTAALAVGTAVIGFFTDFKGERKSSASIAIDGHGGAQLSYGGRF